LDLAFLAMLVAADATNFTTQLSAQPSTFWASVGKSPAGVLPNGRPANFAKQYSDAHSPTSATAETC